MSQRVSGYDPTTSICWQFRNKGDTSRPRCTCPACSGRYGERTLAWFGRCRSGSRWFWAAGAYFDGNKKVFGWENTEELATAAAMAALRNLKQPDRPMLAGLSQQNASTTLKELNKAKRAAQPQSNAKGSNVVEYLYGYSHLSDDLSLYRFRITKKTAKRIYYIRGGEWIDEHGKPQSSGNISSTSTDDNVIGYVSRPKIETEGHTYNRGVHWCRPDFHLYRSLEELLGDRFRHRHDELPNLQQLKAEMAAAHPDRGGSNTAFIEARARYVAARRQSRYRS